MKRILSMILLGSLLIGANLRATTIVGYSRYNREKNCYPFSCFASDGGTIYQEIYSSTAFGGVTSFNAIQFGQKFGWAGLMDSASYDVYFSYTPKPVGGLDTSDPNNNIGAGNALFGSYSLSGSMPAVLRLEGNWFSPFSYDPSLGNLLMTVYVTGLTESHGYESFFGADSTGSVISSAYFYGASGRGDANALVTTFNLPEPATLLLLGIGLLGIGRMVKRKIAS